MNGRPTDVAGLRLLVVGASSGIGHAVAVSAAELGAGWQWRRGGWTC
jgi:NAD(P)-dependent dehydrogenase (short-subunit alcohol dehydrogenase family)